MQKINLNGLWDFVVDLDPKYHHDERIYAKPPYAQVEGDRRYWMSVAVPGVWNKYAEKLDIYEGVCWYGREFEIETLPAGATALRSAMGGRPPRRPTARKCSPRCTPPTTG